MSAVNCPIELGIVPISWLKLRYLSTSKSIHCYYQHKNTNREQRKQDSCDLHSQVLQRSQLSDKGRDRANQLVGVKVSVDFTEHKLLSSAHEHEQRDNANETIIIVTDKY